MLWFKSNPYYEEILERGNALARKGGYSFSVTKNKSEIRGIANTDITKENKYIEINAWELKNHKCSIQSFTKALVALHHENEHIFQLQGVLKGYMQKEIAVDILSVQNNIYLYQDNYSNMYYELKSEEKGVIDTYFYLEEHHKEVNAFSLVKEYILNQIKMGDVRYAGKGFEQCNNIEEIFTCFEEHIKECEKQPLAFNNLYYDYENYDISAIKEGNLIFKAFDEIGKDTFRQIETALPNRYEQAKFVCAYTLKEHPEYRQIFSKYKAIRRLDFDKYVAAYKEFEKDRRAPYLTLLHQTNNEETERDNHDD